MTQMKQPKEIPSHCTCPYCKLVHKMPLSVYAHWTDTFTVTCADEETAKGCGKQFSMFQGETECIQ